MAYKLVITKHTDELLDNIIRNNFHLAEIPIWRAKVIMKRLCPRWIM